MWRSSHLSFVVGGTLLMALLRGHRPALLEASAGQTALAAHPSELIAVTSKDGTRIGVECAGTGPTLLFVHGLME